MNTEIVILAAGKGKRMGGDAPKALTDLRGKPFLGHILDTLNELNLVKTPVIVVGHMKEKVKEVFGDQRYAYQEEQLGTGHAVLSAKDAIDMDCDTIIVLSTDQPLVSKETIEKIIAVHDERNPAITLCTVALPDFEDWRVGLRHFGRIVRDENGRVLMNIEYKDATNVEKLITEVNPALYAFDAKWLWDNIENLKNENASGEYYLTDLIKMATDGGENVEAVHVHDIIEALQPNTKEEVAVLEKILKSR